MVVSGVRVVSSNRVRRTAGRSSVRWRPDRCRPAPPAPAGRAWIRAPSIRVWRRPTVRVHARVVGVGLHKS